MSKILVRNSMCGIELKPLPSIMWIQGSGLPSVGGQVSHHDSPGAGDKFGIAGGQVNFPQGQVWHRDSSRFVAGVQETRRLGELSALAAEIALRFPRPRISGRNDLQR